MAKPGDVPGGLNREPRLEAMLRQFLKLGFVLREPLVDRKLRPPKLPELPYGREPKLLNLECEPLNCGKLDGREL